MYRWLTGIGLQHKKHLALLVLLQLGCGILIAAQPRFYQQLVSLAISDSHSNLWPEALPLLAWLAVIYSVIAILQGLSGYVGNIFSTTLLYDLQTSFFDKTSQLSLEQFRKDSAGEFFTTFSNDIGHTQHFFAAMLPALAREIITTTVIICILLYFCPIELTLVALAIVVVVSAFVTFLNSLMGSYARKQREGWGAVHRAFDETVQGIRTVKALAAEGDRCKELRKRSSTIQKTAVKAGNILSVFSPGLELLTKLGSLALLILAYSLIVRGSLSGENFIIFFFYSTLLQLSVAEIAKSLSTFQTEYTGMYRLSSYLDKPAEPEEEALTAAMPTHPPAIEICNLRFGYPQGRKLYSEANLLIPAKATTLLQGKSGSGKSTLLNLLLRFYEPDEGTIYFNDIDIRQIPRNDIRRIVGVVTQSHFIFQESLRSNLLISQPTATDDEILLALEQAQLGEFVTRLPTGLDTVMDPAGRGMSGGEKQRLCIARLLLRQSPIMIFDEPWSNLDLQARNSLAEVINVCIKDATVLVLSHDHPPALKIDRTYHLDSDGRTFILK